MMILNISPFFLGIPLRSTILWLVPKRFSLTFKFKKIGDHYGFGAK
jgi:hypothetical protein